MLPCGDAEPTLPLERASERNGNRLRILVIPQPQDQASLFSGKACPKGAENLDKGGHRMGIVQNGDSSIRQGPDIPAAGNGKVLGRKGLECLGRLSPDLGESRQNAAGQFPVCPGGGMGKEFSPRPGWKAEPGGCFHQDGESLGGDALPGPGWDSGLEDARLFPGDVGQQM